MPKFVENKNILQEFEKDLAYIEQDWSLNLERQLLNIREKISEQMEKNHISKAALSKILGNSRSYVTQLLNGTADIRLSTLFKVLFALGVKPKISFGSEDSEITEYSGYIVQYEVTHKKSCIFNNINIESKIPYYEYEKSGSEQVLH